MLFCILYGDKVFIIDRKVVYVGPKESSQLEGRLALPAADRALLMGRETLPWNRVVYLLGPSYGDVPANAQQNGDGGTQDHVSIAESAD